MFLMLLRLLLAAWSELIQIQERSISVVDVIDLFIHVE